LTSSDLQHEMAQAGTESGDNPHVRPQIKADSEGAGARSYNYRVVMYSGGAELDMRGRCSAGQKARFWRTRLPRPAYPPWRSSSRSQCHHGGLTSVQWVR